MEVHNTSRQQPVSYSDAEYGLNRLIAILPCNISSIKMFGYQITEFYYDWCLKCFSRYWLVVFTKLYLSLKLLQQSIISVLWVADIASFWYSNPKTSVTSDKCDKCDKWQVTSDKCNKFQVSDLSPHQCRGDPPRCKTPTPEPSWSARGCWRGRTTRVMIKLQT